MPSIPFRLLFLTIVLMIVGVAASTGPLVAENFPESLEGSLSQIDDFNSGAEELLYGAFAQVSLDQFTQPLLLLTADSPEAQLKFEVLALDEDTHQHRRQTLHLEPGGRAWLGLEGDVSFERLIIHGDGPFTARVEDASSHAVEILSSSSWDTQGLKSSGSVQCDRPWNLVCVAPQGCTYVSGNRPGLVENGDQVYWNLHVPAGPWTTQVGSCLSTWYNIKPNGCPASVTNCYGQTYAVLAPPVPRPDLVVRNISVTPSPVFSGDTVDISYEILNQGSADAQAGFQDEIWLRNASGSAQRLFTTQPNPQVTHGSSIIRHVTALPISVAEGAYTLEVRTDASYVVDEGNDGNEGNNWGFAPLDVRIRVSELTMEGLIQNRHGDWLYRLFDCPIRGLCTRTFTVRSTGDIPAPVWIRYFGPATVDHDCPSLLNPGAQCTLTIQHTLKSVIPERVGSIEVDGNTVPDLPSFPICVVNYFGCI